MRQQTQAELRTHATRGQATVEFALVLPLVVACAALLFAVLSVCVSILQLDDMARVFARAAATVDDPQSTVDAMARAAGVEAITRTAPDTGIISVTVAMPAKLWILGINLAPVHLRSTASIMGEPQIILGQ